MSGNILKLNVGGKIFQTTRSTLTKYDGYFRATLESGIPLQLDDTGCIFIDRSPKHFESILNFLRDGDTAIPEFEYHRSQLMKEAQYYMLEGLIHLLGGETSEEWKKAYFYTKYLRDWEGAKQRGEIQFTTDEDELRDFLNYRGDELALLLDYSTKFWGDIHENPHIQNFVKKYSSTWLILFHNEDQECPYYSINSSVTGFGRPKLPELTCIEFLEQVERKMEERGPK